MYLVSFRYFLRLMSCLLPSLDETPFKTWSSLPQDFPSLKELCSRMKCFSIESYKALLAYPFSGICLAFLTWKNMNGVCCICHQPQLRVSAGLVNICLQHFTEDHYSFMFLNSQWTFILADMTTFGVYCSTFQASDCWYKLKLNDSWLWWCHGCLECYAVSLTSSQ